MLRSKRLKVMLAVLLCLGGILPLGRVYAQNRSDDLPIISFEQEDINSDGQPDKAMIMGRYMNQPFRVLVYDQGRDMRWSDDWRLGTDFENDVWLFQTAAGDQTKLVIRFSHDSTGYTAELFDDANGDLNVSHAIDEIGHVDITESPFPTLQVYAQRPWILPEGGVNRLVQIKAYRAVLGYLSSFSADYLPSDGTVAQEMEIADSDGDGVADYQLKRDFPVVPPGSFPFVMEILVNVDKQPQPSYSGYLLWPYLGSAAPDTQLNQRDPQDLSSAPILVDWQHSRIRGITGFLAGSYDKDRWYFLSIVPLVKQKINELDWEQFAYYNFAGGATPDMILRLIRSGPGATVQVGQHILHLQKAAFSWHHTNLGTEKWDYKLEVAGLHELPSSVVNFQDFSLREVPFDDLLLEYLARDWAYATFVAAESNQYDSDEGIWEWGTLDGVVLDIAGTLDSTIPGSSRAHGAYLRGESATSPSYFYSDIRQGFRGEFGDLNGQAHLYFSPIDRKLHLFKALMGTWRLGATSEIRYSNLNNDPFIDQWTFSHVITGTQPVTVTKQLAVADSHLIYSGDDSVVIRQARINPSLFETTPPRDRKEWEALGNQLAAQKPEFSPDDFLTMLRQFDGPEIKIEGATVTGYRPTSESGFRFVLELMPGYQVSGPDLLGFDNPEPGEYVVENNGGAFTVTPLVPAQLNLDVRQAAVGSAAPPLQITIDNTGSADARDLILVVEAESDTGRTVELARATVQALAGQTTHVPVDIPSTIAAGSTLRVRQVDSQGQVIANGEWAPLKGSASSGATALFGIQQAPILLPVVGIFAALIALAALLAITRRRGQPDL